MTNPEDPSENFAASIEKEGSEDSCLTRVAVFCGFRVEPATPILLIRLYEMFK